MFYHHDRHITHLVMFYHHDRQISRSVMFYHHDRKIARLFMFYLCVDRQDIFFQACSVEEQATLEFDGL